MAQNPYVVKTIVMSSGERLPILTELATGEPLYEPSLYVLSEIRATNRASSTIDHVLRSIMVLHLYLDSARIDIERRFQEGWVFSLGELDELVRHCRWSVAEQLRVRGTFSFRQPVRIGSAEAVRLFQRQLEPTEVAGHTAANRVRAIRDYLDWLVRYRLARYSPSSAEGVRLWDDWKRCKAALDARVPRHKGRNTIGRREGLPPEVVSRLLSVTSPESSENPWKGDDTSIRNSLMIRWLLALGLRRGELLNVKITDINFQSEEVLVVRRADDPEDSRKNQPKVKTRDRKLPLSSHLCAMTHDYITKSRRLISGAKRHPFLFIAMGTGAPLSLSSVNKLFVELREAFPNEFVGVTPHVLRHTWNDRFSETMDKKKVPEPEEEQMRSYNMGWSPTSKTALSYTRRHVRLKAQQVSLQMQAEQMKGVTNSD